jgi:hypothetical protein
MLKSKNDLANSFILYYPGSRNNRSGNRKPSKEIEFMETDNSNNENSKSIWESPGEITLSDYDNLFQEHFSKFESLLKVKTYGEVNIAEETWAGLKEELQKHGKVVIDDSLKTKLLIDSGKILVNIQSKVKREKPVSTPPVEEEIHYEPGELIQWYRNLKKSSLIIGGLSIFTFIIIIVTSYTIISLKMDISNLFDQIQALESTLNSQEEKTEKKQRYINSLRDIITLKNKILIKYDKIVDIKKSKQADAEKESGSKYDEKVFSNYLHYLIKSGQTKMIPALLERKFNLDVLNSDGKTALMVACEKGNYKLVKMLIKAGADPAIETTDGQTAISMAKKKGSKKIVKYLKKKIE